MSLPLNSLVLANIDPKHHERYSPNLFRWLKKNPIQAQHAQVWRDQNGDLWIGYNDDDIFLIGTRLVHVLSHGVKSDTGAYPLRGFTGGLTLIEDFWTRYMEIGRCAIDAPHQHHFLNATNRFISTEKDQIRTCRWCGQKQILRTKSRTVIDRTWVND